MKALLTIPFCLLTFVSWPSMAYSPTDLEKHFQDIEGAFVLYNTAGDTSIRYNPSRCATRFSPCSTFKIANALISLEEGVIQDEQQMLTYDAQRHPRQEWVPDGLARKWYRNHNLQTAFQYSAVWFFQELALAVGPEKMQQRLAQIGYGNEDISSGQDSFWLDGSLLISADEQVVFLNRLYHRQMSFSQQAFDTVQSIMLQEQGRDYSFSYKTGTDLEGLCWLVGYVERDNNVWFFAFNAQLPEEKRNIKTRIAMVRAILADLGVLPAT